VATRATVAAVIPVFNVERVIRATLESVKWCDEIIVVDMFSTDETKAICTSYPNCRFFQRRDYIFSNFNYGVEQATAEWIIRLDSDEVITPDLRSSIEAVLSDPGSAFDGYEAQSNLFFFGYPLK
jgi:glycosyltransferase involved in cell wall biosynthesis